MAPLATVTAIAELAMLGAATAAPTVDLVVGTAEAEGGMDEPSNGLALCDWLTGLGDLPPGNAGAS